MNKSIIDIKRDLIRWNELYRKGKPEVPDIVYDKKLDELRELISEDEFNEFRKLLFEKPGKFKHTYIVSSLDKIKYEESEKLHKWLKKNKANKIIITPKIDGNSMVVYYNENGCLCACVTRGDGIYGEDKFYHIYEIDIIPTRRNNNFRNLIVRGEIVIHRDDFNEIKKEYPEFKNPRNLVAGILHRDEVSYDIAKRMKFYAFSILNEDKPFKNQDEELQFLKEQMFLIPPFKIINNPLGKENLNEILKNILIKWKDRLPYDIDGLVLTLPDKPFENKYIPDYKIAFKLNDESAITVVRKIEWNTTKTGKVIPLVYIKPVELKGTTVSKATGHNYKFIIENNIGVDAKIEIIKSGDIIPKIINVIEAGEINIPTYCKVCGNNLRLDETKTHLVCDNPNCYAKIIGFLTELLNRFDIKGISEKLLEKWNLRNFRQIINFIPNEKYKLEVKFREEIDKKILTKTKEELFLKYPFDDLAEKTLKKILDFYGLDELLEMEELPGEYPEGIKEKTMEKLLMQLSEFEDFLDEVIYHPNYNPANSNEKKDIGKVKGLSFCITGTLSKPRKEIEKMIIESGGEIKSVSKKLDYLVVGEKAGSKLEKAKKIGIKIINEEELMKMLE